MSFTAVCRYNGTGANWKHITTMSTEKWLSEHLHNTTTSFELSSIGNRKISADLKLAAICLHEQGILQLREIWDCVGFSCRTFYCIKKLHDETDKGSWCLFRRTWFQVYHHQIHQWTRRFCTSVADGPCFGEGQSVMARRNKVPTTKLNFAKSFFSCYVFNLHQCHYICIQL